MLTPSRAPRESLLTMLPPQVCGKSGMYGMFVYAIVRPPDTVEEWYAQYTEPNSGSLLRVAVWMTYSTLALEAFVRLPKWLAAAAASCANSVCVGDGGAGSALSYQ